MDISTSLSPLQPLQPVFPISENFSQDILPLETTPIKKLDSTFPDLVLKSGGVLHSSAIGVPADGNNTFKLAIPPASVDVDWLEIEVIPLGPSITASTFISLSENKENITINFTQTGSDQAMVNARIVHSIER